MPASKLTKEQTARRNQALVQYFLTEEVTLEEIGKKFNITRERARQILRIYGLAASNGRLKKARLERIEQAKGEILAGMSSARDAAKKYHLDTTYPLLTPEEKRVARVNSIWRRVTKHPDGHWTITGHGSGIGSVYCPRLWLDRENHPASWTIWKLTYGEYPKEQLGNLCGKVNCVNPEHWVDQNFKDNISAKTRKVTDREIETILKLRDRGLSPYTIWSRYFKDRLKAPGTIERICKGEPRYLKNREFPVGKLGNLPISSVSS